MSWQLPWSYQGGEPGVLVLCGLAGASPMCQALAASLAEAGFTVEIPALPREASQTPAPPNQAETSLRSWEEWIGWAGENCADMVARCEIVVLAGLSLGATLASELAGRHREIAALVAVDPVLAPDSLSVPEAAQEPLAALQAALPAVLGELERISCPLLLFSTRDDPSAPSGDLLMQRAKGSKERVWLEGGGGESRASELELFASGASLFVKRAALLARR